MRPCAELWSTRVYQAIEDLLCHNRSLNLIEIGTGHCFGPGLDIAGQGSKGILGARKPLLGGRHQRLAQVEEDCLNQRSHA